MQFVTINVRWVFKAVPWSGNLREHHGLACCLSAGGGTAHISHVPSHTRQPRAAAQPGTPTSGANALGPAGLRQSQRDPDPPDPAFQALGC